MQNIRFGFKDYLIFSVLQCDHNNERGGAMYLRILEKDLKRKKTMNIILLIFVTLAAIFIAGGANTMVTVMTSIDSYLEKAEAPDYLVVVSDEAEAERFYAFADENDYTYHNISMIQIDMKGIQVNGKQFNYAGTTYVSTLKGSKVFDCNSEELTEIGDGEIYLPSNVFYSEKNDFYVGATVSIDIDGSKKHFIVKGYVKDALFGSDVVDLNRFFVSENDYKLFKNENAGTLNSIMIYTDDPEYTEKYNTLELNVLFDAPFSTLKMMYFFDTLASAVAFVVSICLILISMVMLRFAIYFTIGEELCEIGVMKAIGIPETRIRGLYAAKYFAVSIIGAAMGFFLSIPFGNMLIEAISKNIIISSYENIALNAVCVVCMVAVIMAFCLFCTRKIKKITPIDAIRNGGTGERYAKKGVISLWNSKLPVIPFMAINDILSDIRQYASMILIFILGILLILLPVNTINTLQSDKAIKWISMADCDLVISTELLFDSEDNKKMLEEELENVQNYLKENGIEAEVYQEVTFKVSIAYNGKTASSVMAFQGIGGVTTDQYSYIEGSAPQNENEVAVSYLVAESIGAQIGDDVLISLENQTGTYTITAINQSVTNLGECVRFYQEKKLDYSYAAGCFGIQVSFLDDPDRKTLAARKELLEKEYPDAKIFAAGDYINFLLGDTVETLKSVKNFIMTVVFCINMLVAVLMVKSFVTKEKSEIAILKAIGFKNRNLAAWQTIRISIVLLFSTVCGALLSAPLSKLIVEPVFRIMGAYSIEFDINKLEVYVFYPLAALAVTSLSAFLSAQSLRKISSSEVSDIE